MTRSTNKANWRQSEAEREHSATESEYSIERAKIKNSVRENEEKTDEREEAALNRKKG